MWTKLKTWSVGGLREIGFFENSDYLMVLSNQGRGLFDCIWNKKIARDKSDYYLNVWDDKSGVVEGVGILENKDIICGGFEHKNVLSPQTNDGWKYRFEERLEKYWLKEDKRSRFIILYNDENEDEFEIDVTSYVLDRAIGFSDIGNTFVFATSSDIHFTTRYRDSLIKNTVGLKMSNFRVFKTGWGIFIQIAGRVNSNENQEELLMLNLDFLRINFSEKQKAYLYKGFEWVKPQIEKSITEKIEILIEEINLVLTDFQEEGLFYAMAFWASEHFGFEMPKFDCHYNREGNKYEFPDLEKHIASCS